MSSRAIDRLVIDLMRRGATLLSETCPNCGGIMLRYKGVTFCPRCSGFTSVEEVEERLAVPKDILGDLEQLLYDGIKEDVKALRAAKDPGDRGATLRLLKEELEVLEVVLRLKGKVSEQG